jgi:phosphate-selective porin OprO/OprP
MLKSWTNWGVCACAVLWWGSAHVQAQELLPPAADVSILQRLEKLEKQNEQLQKQNQELQKGLQAAPRPPESPVSTGLDKSEVNHIVSEFLKAQTDKKKTEAAKPKETWYEVGSDPKMSAAWGINRLTFESANKDFRAHLGGRLQFDNYYYGLPTDLKKAFGPTVFDDSSFFRRIRIEFDGQMFENIEWNFEVDLERNTLFAKDPAGTLTANGNFPPTRFDEMWVGLRNLPVLGNARIGHVRPPQGLECYTSSRNLTFLERSSAFETFLQEFDPGIWFFNSALDDHLFWAATVHRIDPDSKMAEWGKGDYAATGRIAGLPYYENDGRCLMHLGASYQFRSNTFNTAVNERTVAFASPPDFRGFPVTPNFVSTGTMISDHVGTVGLEALAIWGPWSIQAEYFDAHAANVSFPAVKGKNIGGADFQSAYVYVTYFLTGDNRRYDKRLGRLDRVRPNENFFMVRNEDGRLSWGRGAWEVAARYDWIDLSDSGIKGGQLNNYTLGLNWYLNPNLKFQWNWTVADRLVPFTGEGGGAGGPSGLMHAVGMRVQWEF